MKSTKSELRRFLFASLGILLLVLCINLLSWQFKIVSGGMPGYALAFNYVTGFSVGLFLLIINSFILLLSLLFLGKTAGLKAIYGYVLLSFLFEFTRHFMNLEQIQIDNQFYTFFIVVLQGLIAPIGISLVLLNGYSFGSWSSLYPLVNKYYKKISAPLFFLIMDLTLSILVVAMFGLFKGFLVLVNAVAFYYSFRFLMDRGKKYF